MKDGTVQFGTLEKVNIIKPTILNQLDTTKKN